jgi:hypothetical protein
MDDIRIVDAELEELSAASTGCPGDVSCGDDCTCPSDATCPGE